MKNYLNFETEIKDLEIELEKLKDPFNQSGISEKAIQDNLDNNIIEELLSNLVSYFNIPKYFI